MIARTVPMHLNARPSGQHGVHPMAPRMQPPGLMQMPLNQGMPGSTPYAYSNPNGGPQGVQVGKYFLRVASISLTPVEYKNIWNVIRKY